MNRIVMWTGVYKFNWPLTTALIEMLMTHCWILLSAYITRWTSPWLVSAGVSSMVAPSKPLPKSTQGGFRGMQKNGGGGILGTISRWTSNFSGGIAGGGLFEMESILALAHDRMWRSRKLGYILEYDCSHQSHQPIDHDVPVCTQSGIFVADHGWVQITSVRLDWDWHVLVVLWVVSDGEEEGGEIG
ncbi:hypothetical protein M7I_7096 [Glarea lozoyensis 74030]|uniref:Uncharacterized protein n=1 Tax=Glarea lozoyensis (strain ATCC 74030 / MF5533) TaxID=1104152 RepID=H0EWD1_GLAL7|nr:hypothetical protein M7I_7096 [Glarea lozoyensis 74030]